jgi:hypothetical protein
VAVGDRSGFERRLVRGGWPVGRSDVERAWDLVATEVPGRSTATTGDSELPASAVPDAVAEREGVDPTDLPPLYDAVGPDVLEVSYGADADGDRRVTFEWCGYRATVSSNGSIVPDG